MSLLATATTCGAGDLPPGIQVRAAHEAEAEDRDFQWPVGRYPFGSYVFEYLFRLLYTVKLPSGRTVTRIQLHVVTHFVDIGDEGVGCVVVFAAAATA